jgi:hypothetical protein
VTAKFDGIGAPPRLRFSAFDFDRAADSRCRARVVLSRTEGGEFVGEADGVVSPAGELRCAAAAALGAIVQAAAGQATFDLLGVKAVRAFDQNVVIVSIAFQDAARTLRLVGSHITETNAPRGAALAVLSATNRVLGNYLSTR